VRKRAAEALLSFGPQAVPDFAAALSSPDHNVREATVRALARAGPDAIPLLQRASEDADIRVRRSAVAALAQVGGPARAALRSIAARPPPDPVARAARKALVKIAAESRSRKQREQRAKASADVQP
jgi:HEAT repeat protein